MAALEVVAMNGIPGPNAARILDVGSDEFMKYVQSEVFEGLVYRGGSTVRFFQGAYGAGKTHLLSLMRHQAIADGAVVVETELTAHMTIEDWPAVTKHMLANMEADIGGQLVRSFPAILMAAANSSKHDLSRLGGLRTPHSGFREASRQLVAQSNPGARRLLQNYLLGERIGAGRLKEQGVRGIKSPLSAKNGEAIVRTVTSILHAIGFPGTLMLFDENEQTFVVHGTVPRRVISAANLMRRMIDSCTTGAMVGTATVFAVLPGFLNRCAEAYPALAQRLYASGADMTSWRAPVLDVTHVSSAPSPEAFLRACIRRYVELAHACGSATGALTDDLERRGQQILNANAGSGYRRPLMKAMASRTLEVITA